MKTEVITTFTISNHNNIKTTTTTTTKKKKKTKFYIVGNCAKTGLLK